MRLEYGFSQGERGRSYGEIQGRTPNRLLTKTGQPCAEFLHPRLLTVLDRNLSTTMGHSTGLIREQCPVW